MLFFGDAFRTDCGDAFRTDFGDAFRTAFGDAFRTAFGLVFADGPLNGVGVGVSAILRLCLCAGVAFITETVGRMKRLLQTLRLSA